MSEKLVSLALAAAYAPLLAMALLWVVALVLGVAGMPGLLRWLTTRTSLPRPEQNPPPAAS